MSFQLIPATAFWIGFAALAGGLYLLQRLRVRHREVVVPTTRFWQAARHETRARVFSERFRHPLAYLLLLIAATLLWLAVAEPAADDDGERRATVFLLDGSAGMAWGDRFERAKRTLREQVRRVPEGRAEVLFCGGWPRTVLARGEHPLLLERRLARLRPEACPGSLERAVAALPPGRATTLVVVGDAPLRSEAVPPAFEVRRPGRPGDRPANGGVLALGVAEAASGAWDRVDVFVDAPAGSTVNLESLRDVPARGQEVVVRAPGNDAIALDDEARIVLPDRALVRVRPAPEWDELIAADPGAEAAGDGVAIELVDGDAIVIEGPEDALAHAPSDPLEFVDAREPGPRPRFERRAGAERRITLGRDLLGDGFNFTRSRAFPLFVARAWRWLAARDGFAPYRGAGEPVPGAGVRPPVAGPSPAGPVSLLDPLPATDAPRDDGIARASAGGDPALWIALLAFALLVVEWYLHRTGRVP